MEQNGAESTAIIQSKQQISDRFSRPKFYGKLAHTVRNKKIIALLNLNAYQFNALRVGDTVAIIYDVININNAHIFRDLNK